MSDFKFQTLDRIKEYTGLELEVCDYFVNQMSENQASKCFDVMLIKPMWLSNEFDKLKKFADDHEDIEIEYAGYKRVRIYSTKKNKPHKGRNPEGRIS